LVNNVTDDGAFSNLGGFVGVKLKMGFNELPELFISNMVEVPSSSSSDNILFTEKIIIGKRLRGEDILFFIILTTMALIFICRKIVRC
jgi:hypothetical protein